jgi:hypothetical protein
MSSQVKDNEGKAINVGDRVFSKARGEEHEGAASRNPQPYLDAS